MKAIKILGYLGLLATIIVGLGEHFLHYSPSIFEYPENYEFFRYVPIENLTRGHFLAVLGLPFYFAGYFHIYYMLRSGNETLARIVLATGFIAFSVGGIWIGSRASIGNIVHLRDSMDALTYQNLLTHYEAHMEILVQVLRVVIVLLSVFFVIAVLKGDTLYDKWMAICNPIVIFILVILLGKAIPSLGKHMLPILMNVTHFILFILSLYQLNKNSKKQTQIYYD